MTKRDQIKNEMDSDIILLQQLNEKQKNADGIVGWEKREKEMIKIEGRIEGLNLALKIIDNL